MTQEINKEKYPIISISQEINKKYSIFSKTNSWKYIL